MRRLIAVILFTLFNLGTFGVSIEQHLCCHSQQEESTINHCDDNESCCDDTDGDCCDKIVSQVKISKDFTSQDGKINFELSSFVLPTTVKFYSAFVAPSIKNSGDYSKKCYFPPPKDFQVLHSSFLI